MNQVPCRSNSHSQVRPWEEQIMDNNQKYKDIRVNRGEYLSMSLFKLYI